MTPYDHQREHASGLKWWQGVIAVVVIGIGAQLLGGLAALVAIAIETMAGGGSLAALATGELSFAVIAPSLIVTGAAMVFGSILAAFAARIPVRRALGIRGAPWPAFVAAPIGILALGPTSDFLRRVMQTYLPGWTFGTLEQLQSAVHSAPVWVVAPLFALVPGIAEEVLFRGAFQRSIRNGALAVLLSGLLFSAYHTDPHHIVAVLPLGLYLAWLGHRTGGILVPITAHAANNAAAVIASVFFTDESAPTPGLGEDLWWMPAGWIVVALALAAVWWSTRPRPPRPVPPTAF